MRERREGVASNVIYNIVYIILCYCVMKLLDSSFILYKQNHVYCFNFLCVSS